MSARSSAG